MIRFILFLSLVLKISALDLSKIEVFPNEIKLNSARSCAQIIVTGHTKEGKLVDLSRRAEFTHNHLVKIDNAYVSPLANGKGEIRVSFGKHSKSIPLSVSSTDKNDPVSFNWETLAILTKQGCNGGGCHGKPNGRGALELSLNAFDPDFDETNLIRGAMGRFLQPISPEKSLLLKKPTMQVGHVGGKRLNVDSLQYKLLLQWIKEGANSDKGQKKLKALKVFPGDRVLEFPNQDQQLSVWAFFEDGSFRDVTRIAMYTTSHKRVATVDDNGLVSGHDRGQSAISVRYIDDVITVNFTMVKKMDDFKWKAPKENNYIDTLVNNKLRQLQYLPSETVDDNTFIRRISLDVRGQLPKTKDVQEFVADTNPLKRSRLIDEYLDSDEHARFYAMKTADLLKVNTHELTPQNAAKYSRWIYKAIKENMPFDQFTEELLLSQGHTNVDPRANFFRTTKDSKMVTESVTQLFMGSRLTCAQCHNHPYESWTQDNYYQITSAFNNVDRHVLARGKGNTPARKTVIIEAKGLRNTSNPRTKIEQKPWPINIERESSDDPRKAFVRWLTNENNPYFAKTEVNRIWSHLLGRGIVMPVDDFRPSNPPVNKELLDALAKDFADSGYDRKHIFRQILNSQTYQRSTQTNVFNKDDNLLFSHARTRMLGAEQVKDAIMLLCDAPDSSKIKNDSLQASKKLAEVKQLQKELDENFPQWLSLTQRKVNWIDLKHKTASQIMHKEKSVQLKRSEFIELTKIGNNQKNDRLGSLRSYHQLDNGQFDALRFIYEKNNQGKFGNGKNGNYGQTSQNAWIINDGVGTQVKKIELHSNRDNVIGEIELLMDGDNVISQAKITDISGKREFKKFVDGNLDAFKSSPNLKIEFPTSQSIQFLCIHGHHNATIKFYDHKNILIHEAKLTSKRRLDTSTVALPSVRTIDIIAAQYWETHGNQVKIREVNSSGKWQPHSNHIKPNFLIAFNNQKTKKGQHLVLEQKYLDRNDGPPAKFKVQFAHGPEVVAQASLDKNVLNIAKKFAKSLNWQKDLLRYKYYQSSKKYQNLKTEWEKSQNPLEKIFATQKLYPEKSKILTAFGQPKRETVCACERPESVALDQSLQLMNGEYVKEKIKKVKYNQNINESQNINNLYMTAYSRMPTEKELEIATHHLKKSVNKDLAMHDLYWVVINSNEFVFQH